MKLRSAVVLGILAFACGGAREAAPGASPEVSRGDGGTPMDSATSPLDEAADAGEDAAQLSELTKVDFEIPLVPLEEGSLSLFLVEQETTSETATDEHTIRLAMGEGYPDRMQFELASLVLFSNEATLTSRQVTVEDVTSLASGLEVRVSQERRIELAVLEAGTHAFQLEATADFEGGTTQRFSLPVSVEAILVAGVEWSTCTGSQLVVSGSPLRATRLYPLDEAGTPFAPRNTAFNRTADLIVRTRGDTSVEAPSGIDSLLVTGPSQAFEVLSNFGPVATLELIQPYEVNGLTPVFISSDGGARGGSVGLVDGGQLSVDFEAQPYVSVFPGASFGGIPLCGSVDPLLFELSSSTPGICTIQESGCAELGCPTSEYVPSVARLIAPGTCKLRLDAPTLDHGNGLSVDFTATFNAP